MKLIVLDIEEIKSAIWNPDGMSLAVSGKKQFCVMFAE
jgi:hypothetical protein